MRVISSYSIKGGVGKTALSVNRLRDAAGGQAHSFLTSIRRELPPSSSG
jgi:hypothetical protein